MKKPYTFTITLGDGTKQSFTVEAANKTKAYAEAGAIARTALGSDWLEKSPIVTVKPTDILYYKCSFRILLKDGDNRLFYVRAFGRAKAYAEAGEKARKAFGDGWLQKSPSVTVEVDTVDLR